MGPFAFVRRLGRSGAGLLLVLAAGGAPAPVPKRVLVLHSFGRDVAPHSSVASAFRTRLAQEMRERVDIYEAPLDIARFPGPEAENAFLEFLEQRFAGQPLDLVVPIGGPAARFASTHRETLLKETPFLYTAVDPRMLSPSGIGTNATILVHAIDVPGLVEDMLRIQPETTNIVAVLGASKLEQFWAEECRREWQGYTNRITFTWLNGLALGEVERRVRKLPPRSFIFFILFVTDGDQVPYDGHEPLKIVHAAASAPVYGLFQSQFGQGTIGGRLYQDTRMGERAAVVAARILRGEPAAGIPAETMPLSDPVFDWRELKRWGIGPSQLPPGSVIRFRQPTFWQHYGWWFTGGLGFCLLQGILIVGLVANRAKRRQHEKVATLIADLSSRFIHLPPDEVDREILDAQRRVCECLDLDVSTLWQWADETPRFLRLTHLYRPHGGPPTPKKFDSRETFPWCVRELLVGRIVLVSSIAMLPPEAAVDKQSWVHFGIKSSLTFPLSAGGGGILGALV